VKITQYFLISRQLKFLFLIAISFTATYVQPTRMAHSAEVSIGVAFVNARVAPLWIADKEGFFKKNGIEAKIL
jgi:ABC-type nitrate/sulfonate/bicarbonate transport system substrate-binding protein